MEKRVRGLLVVLLVLTIGLAGLLFDHSQYEASGASTTYFVAPNGNDAHPGTISQPFLTIDRARAVARSVAGNVTVNLRGGVYELGSTVNFVAADSGKSGIVTYRSNPGEVAVVRGSKAVAGFTAIGGGIYQADLIANGLGSASFDQVFFNSSRMHAARYPNYVAPNFAATDPWAGNFIYAAADQGTSKSYVKYTVGAANAAAWSNPTTGQVNIFGNENYINEIRPITSVSLSSRQINLASATTYDLMPNNRFFVSHIREELDAPGEWFHDTVNKKLLVIPPAGTNIATSRVSVPVVDEVFRFSSANAIALEGMVIEETKKSTVILNTADSIGIRGNVIRNSGLSGVEAVGKVDRITIDSNEIYDTGLHGIWFLPDKHYQKLLQAQSIQISNNRIYRAGAIYKEASGIRSDRMVGGVIANNELRELPRIGIFVMSGNVTVEGNLIYDVNRETEDTGGIYLIARSWILRGNVIRNNFIKDTGGYGYTAGAWKYKYYSRGIYLDDFSSGNKVYNNIVARSTAGAYMLHGGMDNEVYNNIAANDTERQTYNQCIAASDSYYATMWAELENLNANGYDKAKYFATYPALSKIKSSLTAQEVCSDNKIYRNIFYFPNAGTHAHLVSYLVGVNGTQYAKNLFWSGAKSFAARSSVGPAANYTWDSWRALGYDTDSIIGDPLFKDPGSDNYELLAGSPAGQIGFEPLIVTQTAGAKTSPPIDTAKVNVYNKASTISATGQKPTGGSTPSAPTPPAQPAIEEELTELPANNLSAWADQLRVLGLQQASVVIVSLFVILLMICSLVIMFLHRIKFRRTHQPYQHPRRLHL